MKTRSLALPAALSLLLLAPTAQAETPSSDVADAESSADVPPSGDVATWDGSWADVGPDPDGTTYVDVWYDDSDVYPGECAADADCATGEYCGIDGWCWAVGDGPCETDVDCGDGNACLYQWCEPAEACTSDADCWTEFCGDGGYCATPPTCANDTDCADGDICDWGYCAPKGSRCLTDAECPDMSYCDPSYWGSAGSGSGGGAVPAYDAGPSADASYEDVPPDTWTDWGACVVDPALVTVTSDCQALCAAVLPCMTDGGGSPPPAQDAGPAPGAGAADPGAKEDCEVSCSYADTTGAFGAGDLHAFLTCATENAACEDMLTACGDELQTVGSALESLPVEFGYDDEPVVVEEDPYAEGTGYSEGPWDDVGPGPSGDTAVGEPMDYIDATMPAQDVTSTDDTAGTSADGAAAPDAGTAADGIAAPDAGTTADGTAAPDAGTTTTPPASKADSGGCNAGGATPALPAGWLLLGLLGLAALRRRLS